VFLIYKADVFIVRLFGGCVNALFATIACIIMLFSVACSAVCSVHACVRARSVDNYAPLRQTRAGRFAPICRRTVADAVCNSF